MLIGACDPMACPTCVFRYVKPTDPEDTVYQDGDPDPPSHGLYGTADVRTFELRPQSDTVGAQFSCVL